MKARALEGTQREPVLGDLVARAGCPDLAAQVRHFLDGQTGLAGDHHQVRVLEDLVQLDDRLGLFRTIHGFLQLWPNPGDPDRTGCVTDHAASVSGLARTETSRSGSPAPEVRARARTSKCSVDSLAPVCAGGFPHYARPRKDEAPAVSDRWSSKTLAGLFAPSAAGPAIKSVAATETQKLFIADPRSVERGGRVELDARTHGGTQRHLLDEGALGAGRLGAVDRASPAP